MSHIPGGRQDNVRLARQVRRACTDCHGFRVGRVCCWPSFQQRAAWRSRVPGFLPVGSTHAPRARRQGAYYSQLSLTVLNRGAAVHDSVREKFLWYTVAVNVISLTCHNKQRYAL